MPERIPRRARRTEAQITLSAVGGAEPPRRRTRSVAKEPEENRVDRAFNIIKTMEAPELREFVEAVRENLIVK